MSKVLKLDEVMSVLYDLDKPLYELRANQIKKVLQQAAGDICYELNIVHGDVSYDFVDGGAMIGFHPLEAGMPIPDKIAEFDKEGDWEPSSQ